MKKYTRTEIVSSFDRNGKVKKLKSHGIEPEYVRDYMSDQRRTPGSLGSAFRLESVDPVPHVSIGVAHEFSSGLQTNHSKNGIHKQTRELKSGSSTLIDHELQLKDKLWGNLSKNDAHPNYVKGNKEEKKQGRVSHYNESSVNTTKSRQDLHCRGNQGNFNYENSSHTSIESNINIQTYLKPQRDQIQEWDHHKADVDPTSHSSHNLNYSDDYSHNRTEYKQDSKPYEIEDGRDREYTKPGGARESAHTFTQQADSSFSCHSSVSKVTGENLHEQLQKDMNWFMTIGEDVEKNLNVWWYLDSALQKRGPYKTDAIFNLYKQDVLHGAVYLSYRDLTQFYPLDILWRVTGLDRLYRMVCTKTEHEPHLLGAKQDFKIDSFKHESNNTYPSTGLELECTLLQKQNDYNASDATISNNTGLVNHNTQTGKSLSNNAPYLDSVDPDTKLTGIVSGHSRVESIKPFASIHETDINKLLDDEDCDD